MKILMFAPIFPPVIGGPATQCASLCKALVLRGHEPIVLTPGKRFSKAINEGYVVYRYPWEYTSTALDRLIRWCVFPCYFLYVFIRVRPHILHAHSVSSASFVAGLFSKIAGIPSIIKFAGDWVWETLSTTKIQGEDFEQVYRSSFAARTLRAVERVGVGIFSVVWVPSDFRRLNVKALMGTDEKVVQIPNSLLLPPTKFHEWMASQPATVISANRFIPHKRIDMIVRAFAVSAPLNAKLVLIGSGEEDEIQKVREEIKRLGISDRVELAGRLSSKEVYDRFASATLYVSASLEEGFPNVFIEAMHFGLPIIATDAGGSREMIDEGKTGYVVGLMDEAALVERMRAILGDPNLRNRMSRASQERAQRYDLSVIIEDFIALYTKLAKKS